MFLLDSLMISGLRWTLRTIQRAADAELNDDAALRDRLLEAEMRRESGEISDETFAAIERDVLGRIREIRERRGDGIAAIAFGQGGAGAADSGHRLAVEATIGGDFHEPVSDPPQPEPASRPRPRRVRRPASARSGRHGVPARTRRS